MRDCSLPELPSWLLALDDAMQGVADAYTTLIERATRIRDAVAEITVSMARDAGYRSPQALVTERYEGMFRGLDAKVVQPALRAAGFSQSETALMCGVTKQAVKKAEHRKREAERQGYSVPPQDNATVTDDHASDAPEPVTDATGPQPFGNPSPQADIIPYTAPQTHVEPPVRVVETIKPVLAWPTGKPRPGDVTDLLGMLKDVNPRVLESALVSTGDRDLIQSIMSVSIDALQRVGI